jgi:hypothetical protein
VRFSVEPAGMVYAIDGTKIERQFQAKGWRLQLREKDEAWEAWFDLPGVGSMLPTIAQGDTRREAAEAAWLLYQQRPGHGDGNASL